MRRVALASALLCATACDGADTSSRPETIVRDSAGVTIVENPAPDPSAIDTLGGEPVVVIGMLDGPDEYLLADVETARRLDDGRIAVLNGGTREVRYYDGNGGHLQSVGGHGEGPGEFIYPTHLWRLSADSLLVYDWDLRRITLLDEAGAVVTTVRLDRAGAADPYPIGLLSPDRLASQLGFATRLRQIAGPGIHRPMQTVSVVDWRTPDVRPDSILSYVDRAWLRGTVRGGLFVGPVFMAPMPSITTTAGLLHFGPGDVYEIRSYDMSGALVRIVRRAHEAVPVTPELRAERVAEYLARYEDDAERRSQVEALEQMPVPEHLPAHGVVRPTTTGGLWVLRWGSGVGPDVAGGTWEVFDDEGRLASVLVMPPGFSPLEIGRDYVLGLHADELGVETVRLYRLEE